MFPFYLFSSYSFFFIPTSLPSPLVNSSSSLFLLFCTISLSFLAYLQFFISYSPHTCPLSLFLIPLFPYPFPLHLTSFPSSFPSLFPISPFFHIPFSHFPSINQLPISQHTFPSLVPFLSLAPFLPPSVTVSTHSFPLSPHSFPLPSHLPLRCILPLQSFITWQAKFLSQSGSKFVSPRRVI